MLGARGGRLARPAINTGGGLRGGVAVPRPPLSQPSLANLGTASALGGIDDVDLITKDGRMASIEGYFDTGFKVNGVVLHGSVLVFPTMTLLWDATCYEEITRESLALIPLMLPKADLIIVGTGETVKPIPDELRALWDELDIGYEQMDTWQACGTFNMLSQDGRQVVAAILSEQPFSARKFQALGATAKLVKV